MTKVYIVFYNEELWHRPRIDYIYLTRDAAQVRLKELATSRKYIELFIEEHDLVN